MTSLARAQFAANNPGHLGRDGTPAKTWMIEIFLPTHIRAVKEMGKNMAGKNIFEWQE
jgi:hypothetical protein